MPRIKVTDCIFYGIANWSANPNDTSLPEEYCKDCKVKDECKLRSLINSEEAAAEAYYDRYMERGID